MSHVPPPSNALGYATPPLPDPYRRPTVVTVIAIIGIIYATLGLLGGLCSLPQYLGVQLTPNPVLNAFRNDTFLLAYTISSLVLNMVLAGVLLWASIGLLHLKPAARVAMIGYAIISLIVKLAGIVIGLTLINGRVKAITAAAIGSTPAFNTPMIKQTMQYSIYGGVCFSVLLLIWPVLILMFMNQPNVKIAFGVTGDGNAPRS